MEFLITNIAIKVIGRLVRFLMNIFVVHGNHFVAYRTYEFVVAHFATVCCFYWRLYGANPERKKLLNVRYAHYYIYKVFRACSNLYDCDKLLSLFNFKCSKLLIGKLNKKIHSALFVYLFYTS